jgi:hypothetical protein
MNCGHERGRKIGADYLNEENLSFKRSWIDLQFRADSKALHGIMADRSEFAF